MKYSLPALMFMTFYAVANSFLDYSLFSQFHVDISAYAIMPEDCNNGIDDDGNGLIDAFDTACTCTDFSNENLILNGDFESSTGCCFNLESKDICLDDWHLVSKSPDYHQVNCGHLDLELLADAGIVHDGSLVGFGQVTQVRTESIGTCLSSSLVAGDSYRLGISLATIENIAWDLSDDIDIIVYGVRDCQDIIDRDISAPFCESRLSAEAVELFRVNMNSFPNNLMQVFEHEFIAPSNISAILIHSDCRTQISSNLIAYFFMDNVEIFPVTSAFEYNSQIRQVGNICSSPFVEIVVDEQPGISYQWYKDSIPIANADQHSHNFSLLERRDSEFHVLVTGQGACKLIGPYIFQGSHAEYLEETICIGDEFVLGDTLIKTSGSYVRYAGITALGCDSIVFLELEVVAAIVEEFVIEPALGVSLGEVVSIVPTDDFLDRLESYYWQKDNSNERINDPYFATASPDPLVLPVTFYYVADNACSGSESFSLRWSQPQDDTEICDNGLDDDKDGLIDVFDPDCNCELLTSTTEYEMQGNVCTEEITIETESEVGKSYQWYIDERKMDGEVNNALVINRNLSGSIFHVAVKDGISCALIGPIEIRQGNLSEIVLDTFCEGYPYNFEGRMITSPGPYQLVAEDEFGCLKNTTLELSMRSSVYHSLVENICTGETYPFGGIDLKVSGYYQDTLFGGSSIGCDSIVELDLLVDDRVVIDVRDTICYGDQYDFRGRQILASGQYQDSVQSISACDSIYVLQLTVLGVTRDTISATVFSGETYSFEGNSYSPGQHMIIKSIDGQLCDRFIDLTIIEDVRFDIYIPNVFNPRSDNADNSNFLIYSNRDIKVKEMLIYDRWGNEVYQRNDFMIDPDFEICWDGTFKGQLVDEGVYSYRIVLGGDIVGKNHYQGQIVLVY